MAPVTSAERGAPDPGGSGRTAQAETSREWRRTAVITSTHSIIYASDAEQARAFFRDVLGLASVDAHGGWLIFKLPPSELAFHPVAEPGMPSGRHELYLMCDDINQTMAELAAKGVQFGSPVAETGFGLLTTILVPGAGEIGLYEPRHPTAYDI
jgi:catechol 2,3-dioxygenase-like lactoylglutathione lyase family enzyme